MLSLLVWCYRIRRSGIQSLPDADDIVRRLAVDGRDDEPRVIRLCEVCLDERIVPRTALEGECATKHERRVRAERMMRLVEVAVHSGNNPRCPTLSCGVNLSPQSVRRPGNRETADAFELQCTIRAMYADPLFRWCAHRCRAGQVHLGDNPLMKCAHEEYTCEKVDLRTRKVFNSGQYRRNPKCGHAIEKTGGCDHMTCRCGHEFFLCCTAPYADNTDIRRSGRLAHYEDCHHHPAR